MLARLICVGLPLTLVVLAAGCGGDGTTTGLAPTPTTSPSPAPTHTLDATTPTPFPIKPASEDDVIWELVATLTAGNILPILRPTALPEGLETVTIVEAYATAHGFMVEYSGPGKRLRIGVAMFNPPLPGRRGHGEAVKLRGQDCISEKGKECVLQVNDDANPRELVWLWWFEHGRWVPEPGRAPLDSVFYMVTAEGLDPQEVLALAEALQPVILLRLAE